MSDENTNVPATSEDVNPLDLVNQNIQPDKAEEDMQTTVTTNWIPTLAICYALSDSFKQDIAKPGDFVLANQQSLGDTISVIPLQYRLHAMQVRNNKEVVGNAYHLATDPRNPAQDEDYQAFLSKTMGKGEQMLKGTDIFFYLPEHRTFGVMFFKKTLAPFANKIWEAGRGGRVVELSTIEIEKNGNTWYNLKVIAKNQCITGSQLDVPGVQLEKNIDIPADKLTEYYKLFNSTDKVETADAEARDR